MLIKVMQEDGRARTLWFQMSVLKNFKQKVARLVERIPVCPPNEIQLI